MKVLVVDDHSYNRELLSFILEDEGHDCIEAENGQEAIDIFDQDDNIELILMDVNMPIMDGIEATKRIKQIAGERFITIIFVTALDNPEVLVDCLGAGGDDFVPKPINENILLSKLGAHARNQKAYANLKAANEELSYHKQLIDREHHIVERIFSNEVNLSSTRCDNISSYTSPASLFNGDLLLTAPSPSGGVYAVVGDFTGHGLSAAVGSLPVSSIFYDCVARQESIGHIACLVNRRLHHLLPPGMFFCAAFIYMEPAGNQFQLWIGGMNDLLYITPGNTELGRICASHMPLGVMSEEEFDESIETFDIEIGSKIYIFTDGINEAKNAEGEEFGFDRVESIIKKQDDTIKSLVDSVREFTSGCDQSDDVSVVEILCSEVVHRDRDTNAVVDVGASYCKAESFPWKLKMHLSDSDLESMDIVLQVGKFLGTIQGVELHQDKIFTIISELYSNALEHGVLRLDSKLKSNPDGFDEYYRLRGERLAKIKGESIRIELAYLRAEPKSGEPNRLKIEISDSGDGFDYENRLSQDGNDHSHGRGLSLLDMFCESLTYTDHGRCATAIYAFS